MKNEELFLFIRKEMQQLFLAARVPYFNPVINS